jgi:hypothetical protein
MWHDVNVWDSILTSGIIPAIGIFLLVLATAHGIDVLIKWYKRLGIRRGEKPMSDKARRLYATLLSCDAITRVLEDADFKGEISKEDKYYIYQRFGKALNLKDLLPNKLNIAPSPVAIDLLKDQIRARLITKVHNPVKLPKEDPVSQKTASTTSSNIFKLIRGS